MTTMTDEVLRALTAERDAALSEKTHEPVKFRATLELTVPHGVPAAAYKSALLETLEAFARRDIVARVYRLEFAPTRTLPPITLETP